MRHFLVLTALAAVVFFTFACHEGNATLGDFWRAIWYG